VAADVGRGAGCVREGANISIGSLALKFSFHARMFEMLMIILIIRQVDVLQY
jgi:hypothetical protein